ncbi:MAG: DUF6049 family protein [Acidimicrobiales bacterium]
MRRPARATGAALALGLLVTLGAPPAVGAAAPAAVTAGSPAVHLVGQSAWVRAGATFVLDLTVSAPDPRADSVQVAAYPPATTRSGFEASAAGVEPYSPTWYDLQPLSGLPTVPGDAVQIRIPVDPTGAVPTGERAFSTAGADAVYPLSVQLFDAQSNPLGVAITTFLVFDAGSGPGFQRLAVALVVPVGDAPPAVDGRLRPVAPPTAAVSAEAAALGSAPTVAVSLLVDPETAVALAAEGGAGRRMVDTLGHLVDGGDQLLPASYAPVVYRRLEAAGLGSTIATQVSDGSEALQSALGSSPAPTTWAVGQTVDDPTLADLRAAGLTRLVVPDSALTALPPAYTNVTFGRPTPLSDGAGGHVEVWGADAVLSARLAARTSPVLAAEQDLAELAVTQEEEPSVLRGVALFAPPDVSPQLLATFVQGLAGNPFAVPVTVSGLFRRVHLSPGTPTRNLDASTPPAPVGDQPQVVTVAAELNSFRQLVPSYRGLAASVERAMLDAESSRLQARQGAAILATAHTALERVERRITLPQATSITFTARSGTLPVTVQSLPRTVVHAQLVLSSPKLQFRPVRGLRGSCRITAESEICQLTLSGAVTVVRLPVTSRTSGVFALTVELLTPDGSSVLASDRDSIRSTAVSWVGLVLMVGAGLSLLLWWIRNLRHGRRARRLVPPPGDDGSDEAAAVAAGMSPSRP